MCIVHVHTYFANICSTLLIKVWNFITFSDKKSYL